MESKKIKLFIAFVAFLVLPFAIRANEATNDPLPSGDPYVTIENSSEEGNPAVSDDEDMGDFRGGDPLEEGNPAVSDDEDMGDFRGGDYSDNNNSSGSGLPINSGTYNGSNASGSGSGSGSGAWQRSKERTSQLSLPEGTIAQIVFNLASWILLVFGSIAVIGFVISGILYLTAAGDDEKMKKAKQGMIYSIIGVVVGLLGYVVVQAVDSWLWGFDDEF